MNKYTLIILVILISFSTTGDLYRVYVDKEFGFFGVRENSTNFTNYQNKILYIDIGDRVEWENFVSTDERITIVSDNSLWNDSYVVLGWNYKVFGYTFNKSGTYRFHIKENQIFKYPENYNETISTEARTNETLPDWFIYQIRVPTKYQTIIVGKNISNTTKSIPQKPKNKIVAISGSNYTRKEEIEEEEYDEYSIVPQVTAKIDKKVSQYEKYTILELLKSLFVRI